MRNPTGLPLVISIKAAEPTEIVDGFIQVNFVTGRAKLGCILVVEGFEKAPPAEYIQFENL